MDSLIPGPQSSWLCTQLEHDVRFLEGLGAIDYSLLLGFQRLHDNERDQHLGDIVTRVKKSVISMIPLINHLSSDVYFNLPDPSNMQTLSSKQMAAWPALFMAHLMLLVTRTRNTCGVGPVAWHWAKALSKMATKLTLCGELWILVILNQWRTTSMRIIWDCFLMGRILCIQSMDLIIVTTLELLTFSCLTEWSKERRKYWRV